MLEYVGVWMGSIFGARSYYILQLIFLIGTCINLELKWMKFSTFKKIENKGSTLLEHLRANIILAIMKIRNFTQKKKKALFMWFVGRKCLLK